MPGTRRASGVKLHPLEKNPGLPGSDATHLPHLRLAAAATYQAITDLRNENDITAIGALYWLVFGELPKLALECMGFENKPVSLLARGLPDKIPERQPGRIKGKSYYG